MPGDKRDISDMSFGEVARVLAFQQLLGGLQMYSYWYTAYNFTLRPLFQVGSRTMDYFEKDDPETPEEKRSFDRLENQVLAFHIALQTARQQQVNRRRIAQSFFGLLDRSRLTEKEDGIIYDSTQRAANAEVKYNKR